jgi:hypothetical protein
MDGSRGASDDERTAKHHEYYGQFAGAGIVSLVKSSIGEQLIKDSKDKHFNDIPLVRWDMLMPFIMTAGMCSRLREAGDTAPNTLCNAVCIAKAAARKIRGW